MSAKLNKALDLLPKVQVQLTEELIRSLLREGAGRHEYLRKLQVPREAVCPLCERRIQWYDHPNHTLYSLYLYDTNGETVYFHVGGCS